MREVNIVKMIQRGEKLIAEERKPKTYTTWGGHRLGYKLGKYYLVKSWFRNSYTWVINDTGETYYTLSEENLAKKRGDYVEDVRSCKAGKERLVELYLEDVNSAYENAKKMEV